MRYRVFLEKKAQKQLENFDVDNHIKEKLIILKEGFVPELNIKKLKGFKNHYRLR